MNNKRKEYQRLYRATKRSLNQLHQVQDNSDRDDGADTQYGVNGALHVPDKQHTRDIPSDQSDFDDKQQAPHNDGNNSDDENNLAWDVIDNLNYVNISSDEEEAEEVSLALDLVKWTNQYQVKHNAVDELLKTLRQHGHPSLPQTARTLLKSGTNLHTEEISGMEYTHLGLSKELLNAFHKYPLEVRQNVDHLEISLNIDGIPLFKSSAKTLWPVLCSINLDPITVFPVSLCLGRSKPNNLDFLLDTVGDLQVIL